MVKVLKVLKWVLIVIAVSVIAIVIKVIHDQKLQAEDQANMVKSDEELIGEHFSLPRDGKLYNRRRQQKKR